MKAPRSWRFWIVIPAAIILLGYASAPFWLSAAGGWLVDAEPPTPADVVVVLAGDRTGSRILRAAELVKQGYAPLVLVSGPYGMYGHSEDELAIGMAVANGYPANFFAGVPHVSHSTREEAGYLVAELKKRGARRVLLVTTNFHTGRAKSVYRELGQGLDIRCVSAPDPFFSPENWWRNREGRKIFFFEVTKRLADAFGI
ncbi:MAG: YdcF family protein [Bryobacteraceae bacterium]|nr:YdcF family protein [Bryobacteraceae bacterium]